MTGISRIIHKLAGVRKPTLVATCSVVTLGAVAAWVASEARRAEKEAPLTGAFLNVDGVQVHYLDRGKGSPIVLLHGNAVRLEDFIASGLVDRLAQHYRVIAFDRPGYGLSERPRERLWTPAAQAELIHKSLTLLGIEQPVVLGHSLGTLVAIALALREQAAVRQLILVSGYYFPTARLDVLLAAPAGIPLIGDVLRYTVSAVWARLMLGRSIRSMFAPEPVPPEFLPVLSREMLVRPGQLRADAEDAMLMIPAARALSKRYVDLRMPVSIFAGEADKIVDPASHARRLHAALERSELHVLPDRGHMLHHSSVEELAAAIHMKPVSSSVAA